MNAARRRFAVAAAIGTLVLWSLPGAVSAEADGPAYGEEGVSAFLFFVVLVVLGAGMAIAEARRR